MSTDVPETYVRHDHDDLWRDFLMKTVKFEGRFATEDACRAF